MMTEQLHTVSPLLASTPLSEGLPGTVWLKMEALQPSGSFKLRGIGNACQEYRRQGAERFVSSSGGNAGIAVAYAGRELGIRVTVVVPETTGKRSIEIIEQFGGEVIVSGASWQEAHAHAMALTGDRNYYLHPFDNPLLWKGHATMIDEVVAAGVLPDAVVLSVGGGGLLCGIMEGLHGNGLADVPVLAVETEGAASLAGSLQAGRLIELETIATIATTLGAKKVASKAFEWCQKHQVVSHVIPDREALAACLSFSDDHRLLVEPACGASLAALYRRHEFLQDKRNILVVVCGGAGVSLSQFVSWQEDLAKSNNPQSSE